MKDDTQAGILGSGAPANGMDRNSPSENAKNLWSTPELTRLSGKETNGKIFTQSMETSPWDAPS